MLAPDQTAKVEREKAAAELQFTPESQCMVSKY
jgi:hypothetical protein